MPNFLFRLVTLLPAFLITIFLLPSLALAGYDVVQPSISITAVKRDGNPAPNVHILESVEYHQLQVSLMCSGGLYEFIAPHIGGPGICWVGTNSLRLDYYTDSQGKLLLPEKHWKSFIPWRRIDLLDDSWISVPDALECFVDGKKANFVLQFYDSRFRSEIEGIMATNNPKGSPPLFLRSISDAARTRPINLRCVVPEYATIMPSAPETSGSADDSRNR